MKRSMWVSVFLLVSCLTTHPGLGGPLFRPRVSGSSLRFSILAPFFSAKEVNTLEGRPTLPSVLPDSLRILAWMVQFQPDEDEKTTGDGRFDLSHPAGFRIDPPPHDRTYFEHQLLALRNYYLRVSSGRLRIGWRVHPEVFTLPKTMADYNPATSEEATEQGIVQLFYDAVCAADAAGVSFSEYDVYLVFHAGVGGDFDLGFDPTPKDIPSTFLNVEDLRRHLAGGDLGFLGIPVEGGTHRITEGLLLPETQSQEGYEIGLLGTAVLMFGFQIGLPALWDIRTGRSGIGRWGLMDQGSNNFNGLIPAEPSAWEKLFLGWETPVTLASGTDLPVACSAARSAPRLYRIPLTADEYYLVENRQHDPDGDGLAYGADAHGNRVTFTAQGNILASTRIGVITEIDHYDYGLPGSGILIWHIDESVLRERLKENRVNADRHRRGVDLEEADGAQDIGEAYGLLEGGFGAETGVLHDAWFEDNEVHQLANRTHVVAFTPWTHPNTDANTGGKSYLQFTGFSRSDSVMTFSISHALLQTGFPVYFPPGKIPHPPLSGDLDGDGALDLLLVTRDGLLFAWKMTGMPILFDPPPLWRITATADTLTHPSPHFGTLGDSVSISPVVFHSAMGTDVLVVATGTRLFAWNCLMGKPSCVFTTHFGDRITALTALGERLFVGTETGTVRVFDGAFRLLYDTALPEKIACFAGSDQKESGQAYIVTVGGKTYPIDPLRKEIGLPESPASPLRSGEIVRHLLVSPEGKVFLTSAGRILLPHGLSLNSDMEDGLGTALADVNQDGWTDVVYVREGRLHGVDFSGVSITHYPVPPLTRPVSLSSPVVADIDGDGRLDVCVTTGEGHVEIFGRDGRPVIGPLAIGGSRPVSPCIVDVDGDSDLELIVATDDGFLWVWDLPGQATEAAVPWGTYLHDAGRSALFNPLIPPPEPSGNVLIPPKSAYNYPNPNREPFTVIRYRLEKPASVSLHIFDLAGRPVIHMEGPGRAPADNEVVWHLGGVEPGVYFCRITASAEGKEQSVVIKIAVVQ